MDLALAVVGLAGLVAVALGASSQVGTAVAGLCLGVAAAGAARRRGGPR